MSAWFLMGQPCYPMNSKTLSGSQVPRAHCLRPLGQIIMINSSDQAVYRLRRFYEKSDKPKNISARLKRPMSAPKG